MSTKLRVFSAPPVVRGPDGRPLPPSPAKFLEEVVLPADGDAAKVEARRDLDGLGRQLRSLNWGPNPETGKDGLIAYVTKS